MSGTNPVFLVRKAKKSSGQKDAVLWCSDDFEAANATLDYLLIKSGAKLKDYFKAVATNFPVVNELPPEGELSLTFCDFYQLGKDNMTWAQIPGVTLPSSDAAAEARQHIVNGVDTETGEVLEDHTEDFGNEEVVDTETGEITQHEQSSTEDNGDLPEPPQLTVVATMPFRHRILAQHIGDGEYLYHVDEEQKKAILALEMDTDNSYVQNLLLASENVEPFKKAIEHDIHKAVNAVKNVFPADGKIPELASVIQFLKTWFDTPHIDRGLLVKEWCKGNRVSAIQRTESGANAGGGIASDRKMPQTTLGLEFEIALGLLARQYEFDIYSLPLQIELKANSIMNAVDDPEWLATRELFVSMPGGLDYSRACIVATVKTTPDELYKSPFRHREYLNKVLTETDHANPDPLVVDIACGRSSMPMPTPVRQDEPSVEEVNRQLAAARGDYVEGISDPNDPKWVHEDYNAASNEGEKTENEDVADVQVQETDGNEEQAGDALRTSESDLGNGEEADTGEQADVDHNQPEVSQNNDSASHSEPEAQQEEPMPVWPEYFEPGRYEGVPNEVYHAANGTSSTMVKDARVSLMYFEARHVSKTIQKERTKVLDMGNLVHALALQPEQLEKEFSIEPEIPEGALTTTATIRAVIDEHNASLPALLTADDIKALLEEYNATLPAPLPLGASVDEAYASYEQLPEEFQRIENGTKHTAAAMKACIKEYNATLPPQVKTSGSRDALLEQLAIINPDLVAQEAQKPQPLKVSGTKADLIQAVKSVKPETVFADELLDAWRENPGDKILVTRQQLSTAQAIQKALLNHPTAGKLLTHPNRAVEVSYFGIDEETGLEIRVRPDLEIDMGGLRIGADLKTISMWNIKQEGLRAKLHREIIDRDYHLSAAMYCETAALDQFFWIFVNKDENYHWIAIIEASEELLELGMLEYRKAMRAIANGFDTGEWPAPITEDYAEELNDFDVRRLEALRVQA
ncbi:TPA: RecE family exodeoxyribonuclease [Citrobacter koseri]|uniref:RecE family exodeoxyribonuclease n=1 Tax=Citrobacter sp. CK207 TaxID=2985116 RepID=UPI001A27208E|nr:RecE family exodeoxyribonuclease [Citrobacter sp. CK207]MDM2947320.1 PD-(D/E)XK nuclease-like domain-containing protein [Citrobacter sp. CK207]HAT3927631.1 exodeoxyribonuclease [Citrobacter koseri]